MSKAAYGRVLQMSESTRQADQVRREREERKEFKREQQERFRRRGAALREERYQTEDNIETALNGCVMRNQAAVRGQREQQRALKKVRASQENQYINNGYALTQKYSTQENQAKVRDLKAQVCATKTKAATEMRLFLKQAKKDTDDDIMEVNVDRCRRVYTDTAHAVIRLSKQQIIAGRWDNADDVRERVAGWKNARIANDAAYVARAQKIAAEVAVRNSEAAERRLEERVAYARKQTQWRKEMKQKVEEVQASVRLQNQSVHDAVEDSHLVRSEEVLEAAGGKDHLSIFNKFFDFRKVVLAETPRSDGVDKRSVVSI